MSNSLSSLHERNGLLFGEDTKAADCAIYESIKTRVAAEISGNPKYHFGAASLPDAFSAADLAR